jgi:carboxyl-terminal processing protease
MTTTLRFQSRAVVLAAGVLALSAMLPASAGAVLSPQLASSVNDSFRLLVKTYYEPVAPQHLVDAARAAIAEDARTHNLRVSVEPVAATEDTDATLAALDQAIADAAASEHVPPTEVAYAAIEGMARSVDDKYTIFMSPERFKEFNEALDPERISGIGVLINVDPVTRQISITYVIPGTPADRGGLVAGDLIAAIDQTPTRGLSVDDASKLLRGKPGTLVRLTISRETGATRDVTIARSEIQPPTVVFKMLPDNIGYIYVLAFGKDTPSEFDTALSRLKGGGAKALVLDLRNDGGGYVDSALEIASRFIEGKALLTVQQRGEPDQTIDAEEEVQVAMPVTVLVNQGTASASEITAGALQDDGIAQLVGTRTFGKGVMQTLTPLADGSAIKITTAHYLTPRHRDINLKGINPDMNVDESRNSKFGDPSSDTQLRAAVMMLQKKIADAKP